MIMKKIFKSISVLAATAIAAVSCNVDAVSTLFDESTVANISVNAAFVQDVVVDQEIPASQTTFVIPMSRSITTEAVTVNLTSTLPAAITCPSSVSFAAGESSADLVLDLTNMSVGETFKGTISITVPEEEKGVTFSKTSVSCTLAKAFTWESLGKGQFLDAFWEGELFNDVEVLKAEGFNIYRFIDPYATSIGEGSKPDFISFTINDDKTVKFDTFDTPYMYDDSHCVTAFFPSEASSSAAAYDAYNKFVDDYYFALVPYWYVNGVGGWGCKYGYTLFASLPGAPTDLGDWYDANFGE